MKILLTVMTTALCVFALATAWVDYVKPQLDLIAKAARQSDKSEADRSTKVAKAKRPESTDERDVPEPDDSYADDSNRPPRRLPTASSRNNKHRNDESSDALRTQLKEVQDRELQIAKDQESLKILYDDIIEQMKVYDDLRRRTSDELRAAEQKTFVSSRQENDPSQRTLAKRRPAIPGSALATKPIPGDSFARTQAMVIRQLVNDGHQESAIDLLRTMQRRDQANVLASLKFSNPRLADELTTRIARNDEGPIRR